MYYLQVTRTCISQFNDSVLFLKHCLMDLKKCDVKCSFGHFCLMLFDLIFRCQGASVKCATVILWHQCQKKKKQKKQNRKKKQKKEIVDIPNSHVLSRQYFTNSFLRDRYSIWPWNDGCFSNTCNKSYRRVRCWHDSHIKYWHQMVILLQAVDKWHIFHYVQAKQTTVVLIISRLFLSDENNFMY